MIESRTTHSEDETAAVARALAGALNAGDVLLLSRNLGAGKTAFVRGLAAGLGINPDDVSSPTFTLVHEYRGGRLTLYHVDLYRLEPLEVDDLGLEELVSSGGIVAIEWAERWRGRPDDAIEVRIEDRGEDRRAIEVRTP